METATDFAVVAFFFFALCLGWLCHIFKKWAEVWKQGRTISLRVYFGENLPATCLSIGAPLLLWSVMAFTGELTQAPLLGAWGSASLGWLGNSAADVLGERSKAFVSRVSQG